MSKIYQKSPFNYQYKVGIANLVDFEDEAVTQMGIIAESNLQNVIVPGSVLVQRGQKLYFTACGTINNPAGTATPRLRINGNLVFEDTVGAGGSRAWFIDSQIVRRAAAMADVLMITTKAFWAAVAGAGNMAETGIVANFISALTVDFSQSLDIQVTVALAGAGDSMSGVYTDVFVI